MEIILGIIIYYLVIGILFSILIYFVLLSEDNLPKEKSDIICMIFICVLLWIILIPCIIYKQIKGGK